MKPFIWIVTILMSLLGIDQVNAQNICTLAIDGQVVDAETGEGLSFASVLLQESGQGAFADSAGFFSFTGICAGDYTLKVSHIGCAPQKKVFRLFGDTTLVFELDHDESILHEFVVEGKEEAELSLTKISLRQAQLETTSGLQLAEQALAIPGMRMQETGNTIAKPVFRGLQGNRLLVLNAGVRQEGQYWGSEHAPEIDPFLAQQVSVIEGVDALRYAPDAIGGLLLVEPADVFGSDSLSGSITGMGATNGRGGALGGELMGRVSETFPLYFRGQISSKKFGDIKTPDVFLDNTGAEELNYSYALGWKGEAWKAEVFYSNFNQRIGIYRYSHLGNLTDLYEVITGIRSNPDTTDFSYDIDRPNQEVGHELFKGSFEFELDDENTIEAIYSRQFNSRKEFDAHVGINPSPEELVDPQLDYALTTHLGELIWRNSAGGSSRSFGVTGLFRENNFRGRNFMPNYRNTSFGIFALEQRDLGIWKLKYGIRYERYDADIFSPFGSEDDPLTLGFDGFSSSLAAKKNLESGDLTLSVATFWRAPAVNELFASGLHHGVGAIEQGNSSLLQERSYSLSATWRKVFGRTRFLATAYANFIDNYIFMNPRDIELTIRGAFPRFDYEQTDALYWGSDLQVEGQLVKGFSYLATASLVWAQNVGDGNFFINIPAHQFLLEIKKTWDDLNRIRQPWIAVSGNYTMEQYRAPEGFPFESVFEPGTSTVLPSSFDFAAAPDGYFLVGARAGMRLGQTSFQLGVENLLSNTYRNYMNRFRYYMDEPGLNITLRVKHNF
ncbi:MAG: iron complex outermembrane receptor protein [Cryomorphaceae bacterium]|jgi:iron complex outermembrane receptor protein